ncbi:MAG: hypothetical protein ATN31_01540 [Candidatus Epulonipiscioides saccharophilum]|nr:MAG: hypothetical protein ATN31_01540 [Epulopiscium sp. AS2M-Bin001]
MAITMKDVARHAGVGLGTVSNYLSGKAKVSEHKSELIEKAIKELNYKFNSTAQALKTKKFMYIGVLIPAFTNNFIMSLLSILEEELNENGYHMIVLEHGKREETFKYHVTHLINRVDGMIVFETQMKVENIIEDSQIPTVIYDNYFMGYRSDQVGPDLLAISKEATMALIKKNHTKIAFIENIARGKENPIIKGYEKAFSQAGIKMDKSLIYEINSEHKVCMPEKISILLARNPDITAFIAFSYKQTVGIWSYLAQNNLLDKIYLLGYNCKEISKLKYPNMCYTQINLEDVVRKLVYLLLKRVISFEHSVETITVGHTLVNENNIVWHYVNE